MFECFDAPVFASAGMHFVVALFANVHQVRFLVFVKWRHSFTLDDSSRIGMLLELQMVHFVGHFTATQFAHVSHLFGTIPRGGRVQHASALSAASISVVPVPYFDGAFNEGERHPHGFAHFERLRVVTSDSILQGSVVHKTPQLGVEYDFHVFTVNCWQSGHLF